MLARGKMIDLEYKVEGKTFEEVKADDAGAFEAPYESFHWKTAVKEIKFPNMNFGGGSKTSGNGGGDDNGNQYAELIFKLLTKYFTKAIREISVTVLWKRSGNEVSYTVSTYWINLNQEFETSE